MGSRQDRPVESCVVRQTVDDPQLRAALQALSQVVSRALGPQAHIQSVQNSVGGPVTMTTSCSRLLSAMAFSRPCIRLIENAVQGHLKTHRDGGLVTASLCLHLVQNAVKLESVGRRCVREAFGAFLRLLDEYLMADSCPISVSVDASNLKVMLGYVRNIIAAKPVCGLRPLSASHIAQLVLKAFLTSVPDHPQSFHSDLVYLLQQESRELLSSEVVEGLLLAWPEKCAQLGPQHLALIHDASQQVKVALVSVSMSGDAEEVLTNRVEAQGHVIQSAADLMVRKMLAFCDWLVEQGVGVLLCQKVMHPKVKAYLRQSGVLFVERLGMQPLAYIQDLTGCAVISSVLARPADPACGRLTRVEHRVLHGKSYLHLQRADSCVCTLLLCAPLEQQLAELQSAVQSAVTGLWSTFQRPVLLCGGGCWQFHLAARLPHMVGRREEELCGELGITRAQLQACAGAFTRSLAASASPLLGSSQAWVDRHHHHLWPAPRGVDLAAQQAPFSCACGVLTSKDVATDSFHLLQGAEDPWMTGAGVGGSVSQAGRLDIGGGVDGERLVLDTKDCVVSAVRTAVLTAGTVLSFAQFIHDGN